MKILLACSIIFSSLFGVAATRKQISQTFANFGTNPQPVYSVTTGKRLEMKKISFSAMNTSTTAAAIQLKDSGGVVIHTFYVGDKETGGSAKTVNEFLNFDEPWHVTHNLNLELTAGTSGSVSASITVLGFEP